jgi:hypothetical protein
MGHNRNFWKGAAAVAVLVSAAVAAARFGEPADVTLDSAERPLEVEDYQRHRDELEGRVPDAGGEQIAPPSVAYARLSL